MALRRVSGVSPRVVKASVALWWVLGMCPRVVRVRVALRRVLGEEPNFKQAQTQLGNYCPNVNLFERNCHYTNSFSSKNTCSECRRVYISKIHT